MTLAERFKLAREKKGFSQEQLGQQVGMTQQSIYAIEDGKSKFPRKIEQFAQILDVDPNWLLFGDPSQTQTKFVYSASQEVPPAVKVVPVYTPQQLLIYFTNKEAQLIYEDVIPVCGRFELDCIGMKVITESMESLTRGHTFENGCYIYVKPSLEPKNGSYVVASLDESDDELVFRKLVIEGGKKLLKPLNSTYETFSLTDKGCIYGVVIGKRFGYEEGFC